MSRALLLAIALFACAAAPLRADDGDVTHLDQGRFRLSLAGRPIGTEDFAFDVSGDSLVVTSHTHMNLPDRGAGSPTALDKNMVMITNAEDFGLRRYFSTQGMGADTLLRGVEPEEGDTLFSVYRQNNGHGEGDRLVLPPGRLFVVDSPPQFASFGLMCHALQGKVFTTRPITLFVLGARDSLYEAQATDLGHERIAWGAAPVNARKLKFSDTTTEFFAWVSPAGNLLRIEQPASGIKAEREPPAASAPKRAAPRKSATVPKRRAG